MNNAETKQVSRAWIIGTLIFMALFLSEVGFDLTDRVFALGNKTVNNISVMKIDCPTQVYENAEKRNIEKALLYCTTPTVGNYCLSSDTDAVSQMSSGEYGDFCLYQKPNLKKYLPESYTAIKATDEVYYPRTNDWKKDYLNKPLIDCAVLGVEFRPCINPVYLPNSNVYITDTFAKQQNMSEVWNLPKDAWICETDKIILSNGTVFEGQKAVELDDYLDAIKPAKYDFSGTVIHHYPIEGCVRN